MDVNIRLIYATTFGNDAMVYISVDDAPAVLEKLQKWEKSAGKLS